MAENDKLPTAVESIETVPSPGTTDEGGRSSLLDAIQTAVPELRTDDADDDGKGESPTQVARSNEPELPEEATPEEVAKYSKTAQRRIRKLDAQRHKLAGEVRRLKLLEPGANMAAQVNDYLRKHDIGQDDFLFILEMAAAMRRGDFPKFHAGISPYMKLAEEYLGISLPPDLQQQVAQGNMTTQAAAMYSKERMDRAMAQTNAVRQQAALQEHQQVSAQEDMANKVAAAVDRWELDIIKSDPNYATKKAAVQTSMMAVVQERGPPRSPEHGVQIAQEGYRRANELYRGWTQSVRRPTSRTPSSTGRNGGGAAPEAKTLLEAVKFAREEGPRL